MKQTIPLTVGVIFLLLCITASSSIRLSLPNMASNDFKLVLFLMWQRPLPVRIWVSTGDPATSLR
ncbi:uncharacterized protein AlkB isoform X6 [Drosophila virilis]|uniref:uncharacterized protein AlkB isoform X6 n=1 Tax=Drosophila virilis TaxID=7244 RepID=UPI001395E224|nr:uncharacterized protein LOC6636874 isoform X7 [Drosophila virilis]